MCSPMPVQDIATASSAQVPGPTSRGQVAFAVERDGADGPVRDVRDVVAGDADRQAVVGRRVLDLGKALGSRERGSACSGQHDVRRLLHDGASNANRAHEIAQRSDGARAPRRAVHDRRVEFDIAGAVGRRAAPGDVQAAGLQFVDGKFDHVQRPAAPLEFVPAGRRQFREVRLGLCVIAACDGAGAPVQRERPGVLFHAANLHQPQAEHQRRHPLRGPKGAVSRAERASAAISPRGPAYVVAAGLNLIRKRPRRMALLNPFTRAACGTLCVFCNKSSCDKNATKSAACSHMIEDYLPFLAVGVSFPPPTKGEVCIDSRFGLSVSDSKGTNESAGTLSRGFVWIL